MTRKDETIDRTLEMFAKPGEYERILSIAPSAEGTKVKKNSKKAKK